MSALFFAVLSALAVEPEAGVPAAPEAGMGAPAAEIGLTAGEFRNNAYTMERGDFAIHPFLKSHYGVTDTVDVKAPILGWFAGPRGSVELGLLQNDAMALSVEPDFSLTWNLRNYGVGAIGRASFAVGPTSRVNVNLGARYGRSVVPDLASTPDVDESAEYNWLAVPVNVGFDLGLSERSTLRFVATTDATLIGSGAFGGTVGVNYNQALGPVRFALGVAVLGGGLVGYDLPDELPLPSIGSAVFLPVPTAELWFRL